EKSPNPDVRQQRSGVKVEEVGPADRLGPAEFKLGESGCSGDSGGPAFAESGAVLGVLSRGGNGSGAKPGDFNACTDAENVFSSAAAHRDLILGAYERAGQAPWNEGDPDPRLAPPPPAEEDSGCAVAGRARREPFALAALALVACLARLRGRRSRPK
ncbi:MAG: trypsin-like serine protease, partial [Labilithrix sp.]|nr:trypsin-like serine protease [Labilithrix sp.]